MPEARKTPESRRFAGLGHDRAAVVAGRNERLRENSPIDDGSMGYGCADTAGMGVEFPILLDSSSCLLEVLVEHELLINNSLDLQFGDHMLHQHRVHGEVGRPQC